MTYGLFFGNLLRLKPGPRTVYADLVRQRMGGRLTISITRVGEARPLELLVKDCTCDQMTA